MPFSFLCKIFALFALIAVYNPFLIAKAPETAMKIRKERTPPFPYGSLAFKTSYAVQIFIWRLGLRSGNPKVLTDLI